MTKYEYSRGVFGNKRQRSNPEAEPTSRDGAVPAGAVDV
jgi:hypothetical protein